MDALIFLHDKIIGILPQMPSPYTLLLIVLELGPMESALQGYFGYFTKPSWNHGWEA